MSRYIIQTFHGWLDIIYNLCLIRSLGQSQNPMCGNETELVDAF